MGMERQAGKGERHGKLISDIKEREAKMRER
jgi:hypothetical protein